MAIFFNQYTSANVTITGQDETIYVTEDDIYIPASATNYQFYKYVDASFTARHDGNPVTQGLVFTIVSGDPSIIKYVKTTMPNGTSNTVNYFIPEIKNKTQLYVKKSAKGGSSSSNSVIDIKDTYLSFALTEVPKEPIVLKLYAWLDFMGSVQTSPAGTSYTDARHNLPTLKEGEKQGTVDTFTPSYDWTDASSATTSSQFALHMGYRFYDNYVATKRTDGTVAKLVTYVTPKSVGAADAARIASGQGTPSTEYLYKVEQPLYISDKATGVADPVADPSLSTPEYYTIEGVRLPGRPSAPGLYIERRGTTATKIFLRP